MLLVAEGGDETGEINRQMRVDGNNNREDEQERWNNDIRLGEVKLALTRMKNKNPQGRTVSR